MRNHNQKIRDMTVSVLPSTRRHAARVDRVLIHRRERARVRAALRGALVSLDRTADDPDLTFEDKPAIREMVDERRTADKVAPLARWARRKVETDPVLRERDWDGRMTALRSMLPDNTIGRHALSHVELEIGTPPWASFRGARGHRAECDDDPHDALLAAARTIIAAGAHGELNARLKRTLPRTIVRSAWTPRRWLREEGTRALRLLHGAHDVTNFARDVCWTAEAAVTLALAEELVRGRYRIHQADIR
jgi:hypothetical protein